MIDRMILKELALFIINLLKNLDITIIGEIELFINGREKFMSRLFDNVPYQTQ